MVSATECSSNYPRYLLIISVHLHKGMLPSVYKEAIICPIHKNDDKSLVNNYQPISLLDAEAKKFERPNFKHIFNHMQENNILTPSQSGLIPGDSTVNQLTLYIIFFCQALN